MIKWYCDICKEEIKEPEHPTLFVAYTESVNRDLQGYGEADYIVDKIYLHKLCAKNLSNVVREAILANA